MTDREVRRVIYEMTMAGGTPPLIRDVAQVLGMTHDEVAASMQRLAEGHMLVLQPGSGEVLMAPPYSAVPTPFVVHAGGTRSFGNCIWDALGIPAVLGTDARIDCSCGCCGEAMSLAVTGDALEPTDGAVHFAIPARRWWEDIVFN